MKAQRASAWLAVESYERKSSSASLAICADVHAIHESHVCVESVRSFGASVQIRTRNGESEIGLTDEPLEVKDDRWVAAIRMGSRGIGRGECTLYRTRKEIMEHGAKGSWGGVGNRIWQLAYGG